MTTNLKSGLVTFLAALTLFGIGASNAAFGACYCMMDSMSVGAYYNKTGIPGNETTAPVTMYLASHTVEVEPAIGKTDDGQGNSEYIFDSVNWTEDCQYDISTITNIYVQHPTDCRTYTLPSTITDVVAEQGYVSFITPSFSYVSGFSGVTTNYTYSPMPPYPWGTCEEGSWFYSDTSPYYSSGSLCNEGSPIDRDISDFKHNTPWELSTSTVTTGTNYVSEEVDYYYTSSGTEDTYSNVMLTVLSQPFTDNMLRTQIVARIPAWPTNWTTGTGSAFYSFNDANHWCANGGKMQYRVKVPDSQTNTTYLLQWQEVTQYPDTTNTTSVPQKEVITGTGDPANPAVGKIHTVDMPQTPSTIYETAPEIISQTSSGGGNSGSQTPGSGVAGTQLPSSQ